MGAPKKYEREFVERAVRMYRDRLAEGRDSKVGARRHVGSLLDLNPATLRNWVEDAERAEGTRAPSAASRSADSEEVRALKKRVAAGACQRHPHHRVRVFRHGGARPPTQVIVAYIDSHRERFGVEPICAELSQHGITIAPSTSSRTKSSIRSTMWRGVKTSP